MKNHSSGMILWTTLCFISIIAGLWLSLVRCLFLFDKVTMSLQEHHATTIAIEQEVLSFLKKATPERLEECSTQSCSGALGLRIHVEKEDCDACLTLALSDKENPLGSQHWFVSAELKERRLRVRWITALFCGVCEHERVLLDSALLSWYLYP